MLLSNNKDGVLHDANTNPFTNMMELGASSPFPQREAGCDQYHHPLEMEDHNESREEEDDSRPPDESSSPRSSSEENELNRHQSIKGTHFSPPKDILRTHGNSPGGGDISPIAVELPRNLQRRDHEQYHSTNNVTLMQANSSGSSGTSPPNEVSFSSSTAGQTPGRYHPLKIEPHVGYNYGPSQDRTINHHMSSEYAHYHHYHGYHSALRDGQADPSSRHYQRHDEHPDEYAYDQGQYLSQGQVLIEGPFGTSVIRASPVIPRQRYVEPHGPSLPQWAEYPQQHHGNSDETSSCTPARQKQQTQQKQQQRPIPNPSLTVYGSGVGAHVSASHKNPAPSIGYYPNNPLYILRSVREAFAGCSYVLQCLHKENAVAVNINHPHMGVLQYHGHQLEDMDSLDLKIARRRIESAVCAFGGYIQKRLDRSTEVDSSNQKSSIFRRMEVEFRKAGASHPDDSYVSRFNKRYFVKRSGISWDVEENPPIEIHGEKLSKKMSLKNSSKLPARSKVKKESSECKSPGSPATSSVQSDGGTPYSEHQQKMKYRCKLCGQPKQNHACPYRKSLQRSIGINVIPVVNGYTAEEPGVLTPALSDMNNFVSFAGSHSSGDSAGFGAETEMLHSEAAAPAHITPPDGGLTVRHLQENSSLSSAAQTPDRRPIQIENESRKSQNHSGMRSKKRRRLVDSSTNETRSFADTLVLRPEHYRAVTMPKRTRGRPSKDEEQNQEGFDYPAVLVSFEGRKRLSDTLYYLTKSIPCISTEVTSLLGKARKNEEWDLAVAQLLTQVIVALHCVEGDYQLEGLRRYLLNIGIST
jgi:hypothetical protein